MAPFESRILVTGAAGLLGARLVSVLARSHLVAAAIHRNEPDLTESASVTFERCDLTDPEATARLLRKTNPDVVVNCAAMTDVDRCEDDPELAERLNAGIVDNLLTSLHADRVYFVQISTDYLFDGREGRYPEDSLPGPVNVYGMTKLLGEKLVRAWGGKSLIVRTSALYDCLLTGRADIFKSIYLRLQLRKDVQVAADLFCNPIWVVNLSDALHELIERRLPGILNVAGPEYLSRLGFSQIIADHYGFPSELIDGVTVTDLGRRACRPLRAGLNVALAQEILRTKLLSPGETFSLPGFNPK